MYKKTCVFITVIVLLLAYKYAYQSLETFVNYISVPLVIVNKPVVAIYKASTSNHTELDNISAVNHNISITPDPSAATLFYTDCLQYDKYYSKNHYALTCTGIPNILTFFTSQTRIEYITKTYTDTLTYDPARKRLADVVGALVIGYCNDIDMFIAKTIFTIYQIDTSLYKWIKCPVQSVATFLYETNTIDVFIYYECYENKLLQTLTAGKYNILYYDDIDTEKLAYYIPYATRKNITLNDYLTATANVGIQVTYLTLVIDTLLYCKTPVVLYAEELLTYFNTPLKINYYAQFWRFLEVSLKFALETQKEYFTAHTLTHQVPDNTVLYPQKSLGKVMIYKIENLQNEIPYAIGDKLEHLGKVYYILAISDSEVSICEYIPQATTQLLSADTALITKDDTYTLTISDKLYCVDVGRTGIITAVFTNSYRVQLDVVKVDQFSDQFFCYEDKSITIPEYCTSAKTLSGGVKDVYTWDKPCVTDIECPFFNANKNYTNNRGGCVNGFCEMPLGVIRLSYRKYADTGPNYPLCHNCVDAFDPNCCSKQLKPDYAFTEDTMQRRRSHII